MTLPTHSRICRPTTARGLTLIEILIVIVIIVTLAAISFIGISRIKAKARSAACISNLKQVSSAILEYATDHQGKLPPLAEIDENTGKQSGIWTLVLGRAGYLGGIPNEQKKPFGTGVWTCPDCEFMSNNYGGYGIAEATVMQYDDRMSRANSRIGKTEKGSLRLAAIPRPSRTWLLGDAALKTDELTKGWYAIWSNPKKWSTGHTPAARHAGRANVCMVDGHIESLTMEELLAQDYTMDK